MDTLLGRRWGLVLMLGIVGAAVALSTMPAWASPGDDGEDLDTPGVAAMHEACEAGDVDGMIAAMESLTDEDWGEMGEHMHDDIDDDMDDDHEGFMGDGMMGMGSHMMGTGSMM